MPYDAAQTAHFIRFLIDGKREITTAEVEARKQALGLERLCGPFVVVKVATDYSAVPHGQKDAALQEYERFVTRFLSDLPATVYAHTDSYNNVVVLLAFNGTAMGTEALNDHFVRLHRQMTARFGMQGFIGIGNVVDTYRDIALSSSTAGEMLGFKFQYGDEGVVNAATIVKFQHNMSLGNGIEFERVIGTFRDGNLGKMEVRLNELAETIRRRPNVSGTSIRRSMVEVTVHVLHLASNAGVDVDLALEGADPYRWILRQNHTEVIIEWILRLSGRLLTMMQVHRESGQRQVIDDAIRYIEDNLSDAELGLSRISRRMGLSDTYSSQLFKKEVGIGISAYITGKRLERAKVLLRDTTLTVADISRQVGFMSASYFGQVFRKAVGQTPQQYRRTAAKE